MILNFINKQISKQFALCPASRENNKFNGAINLFHSSAVVCSDRNNLDVLNNALNNLGNETVSNLQLIKYEGNPSAHNNPNNYLGVNSDIGSSVENFPWLFDEKGQYLKINDPITLFDSIKLVSKFLEKKYLLDPNSISELKIKEIIALFEEGENISVIDLLNFVGQIYNKNKDNFVKDITTSSNGEQDLSGVINEINKTKPLGPHGDITLNEIADKLLNLKWDVILDRTEVTIHALPTAVNVISYVMLLKSYMKYVHNRPYNTNRGARSLEVQKTRRNRELALFALIGLPLSVVALRFSSIGLKDMLDISITGGAKVEENPINSVDTLATPSMSHFGLLLLLNKINNKIPSWVKLSFKLLFISLIVLKLLGYSIIFDVLIDKYFLLKLTYFSCSLVISYELLNLYLIHKFTTKKVKISEVLPDFLIKWLQEFEIIAASKIDIKEAKKGSYIHILIYLIIMVLITLIIF